jgi:hypothetical protein
MKHLFQLVMLLALCAFATNASAQLQQVDSTGGTPGSHLTIQAAVAAAANGE